MNTIDSKVGEGVSKLQEALKQGKKKVQGTQEVGQKTEQIEELKQKRIAVVIDIGNEIHKRVRSGLLTDDQVVTNFSARIEELDMKIYDLSKDIYEQERVVQVDKQCVNDECKGVIQEGDNFCGLCGTPVREKPPVVTELKDCNHCLNKIPLTSAFCPCCGAGLTK